MLLCVACEMKLKSNDDAQDKIEVVRYDRLQSRYLTTGDFSALQEMNTEYAIETRSRHCFTDCYSRRRNSICQHG